MALFDDEPEPVRERFAIDLGCGSGRDTREVLRRGWHVLAIDREAEGVERLILSVAEQQLSKLQTRVAAFEALNSLPFCPPSHFDALWHMIVTAIQPCSRFAGTFFGERDGWEHEPAMTFHTRVQAEALLREFKVEQFIVEDSDGRTALGDTKLWHTFQIVAFKK